MTTILQWSQRHNIPPHVLNDLLAVVGIGAQDSSQSVQQPGASEASVQNAVRMEAAKRYGSRMWRNNSGVAVREDGGTVRYGLSNESSQINRIVKSSDLIGITPIICGCGCKYGVFTAYECKKTGWKFRQSDERAVAQLAFIRLVVSMGGIGKFISEVSEL